MYVTATHINYYHICRRKLWLFGNGVNMEHTSDLVTEGKLVHEIKKSAAKEEAHVWQVKYYLYLFEREEIEGVIGLLEYPLLRETMRVELEEGDRERLQQMEAEIRGIVGAEDCPPPLPKRKCGQCSYYEFCYAGEEE